MKRFLSLMLALLLCLSLCHAETLEDYPVATVNGEDLMYSKYKAIETAYLYQYESAGVDLADESVYTYLTDLALSYALEQLLVEQDMRAQGCYTFDEASEAWFSESGKAAWEQALQDVMDSMRAPASTDDELMVYAMAYAQELGVSEQTYVDYFRTAYAQENYRQWLIRENPITDADVQAEYDALIAESKALYESDAAAVETALLNGTNAWYTPVGYRQVLQILLPAEGATPEEKLANVQPTVDEINTLLAQGESFQNLVLLYGADANLTDEAILNTGYPVHKDSIMWAEDFVAAAFSPEMVGPGSVSKPVASGSGVHILYYLADLPAGPVALTEDVRNMLASAIYQERYTAAQSERINELAAAAQVVIHE